VVGIEEPAEGEVRAKIHGEMRVGNVQYTGDGGRARGGAALEEEEKAQI
jgi:hypothetical protein